MRGAGPLPCAVGILRGEVFFARSLSECLGELEMGVRLQKTSASVPGRLWSAHPSVSGSFVMRAGTSRFAFKSKLSLAAVSSSGYSGGSQPD